MTNTLNTNTRVFAIKGAQIRSNTQILQVGGDKPFITNVNKIVNLFTDPDMEICESCLWLYYGRGNGIHYQQLLSPYQ